MLVIPFSQQKEDSIACTMLLIESGNLPATSWQIAGTSQLCGCKGCSWTVTVSSCVCQRGRYRCYA